MKVAILADIHANIHALNVVLADCKEEKVDHFIVAGDLIGYYYWPRPVVQCLMRDDRFTCIRGNHEDILAQTIGSYVIAERYRQRYGSGYDVCRQTLSNSEMEWLLNLPSNVELTLGGAHFAVYHGSPASTDEYIYPNAPAADLVRCHVGRDFTVLGHTHYPFIHHLNGRILLNPGSVGQPRDFGGQASYALINLANRTVRFKRVPFDVSDVIATAQASDPTLDYLQRIMTRKAL
jgi:putative phosphoesterase